MATAASQVSDLGPHQAPAGARHSCQMASTKIVLRDQLFAPDVQPTTAKPLPLTQEEHDELRHQLDQLLASS
jgi:hypothetical protein